MNKIVHIFTCKVELPSVLTDSYELLSRPSLMQYLPDTGFPPPKLFYSNCLIVPNSLAASKQ